MIVSLVDYLIDTSPLDFQELQKEEAIWKCFYLYFCLLTCVAG